MLDRCYEDTTHPEVKSTGNLLNNFVNELVSSTDGYDSLTAIDKENSKQFIKNYTKYLAVYVCVAQQVLWMDNTMAEYLNTVDVKGYIDACFKQYPQARKLVEELLPAELFIAYVLFVSDEHFQKEVEKYTEQILVTHYSK